MKTLFIYSLIALSFSSVTQARDVKKTYTSYFRTKTTVPGTNGCAEAKKNAAADAEAECLADGNKTCKNILLNKEDSKIATFGVSLVSASAGVTPGFCLYVAAVMGDVVNTTESNSPSTPQAPQNAIKKGIGFDEERIIQLVEKGVPETCAIMDSSRSDYEKKWLSEDIISCYQITKGKAVSLIAESLCTNLARRNSPLTLDCVYNITDGFFDAPGLNICKTAMQITHAISYNSTYEYPLSNCLSVIRGFSFKPNPTETLNNDNIYMESRMLDVVKANKIKRADNRKSELARAEKLEGAKFLPTSEMKSSMEERAKQFAEENNIDRFSNTRIYEILNK